MAQAITATSVEYSLTRNDFIVSKTDLKGNLTYCNKSFLDISQFGEIDLIGHPHNIIRHPDMPKAVFNMLWKTLKNGDEFFGVIKNICLDGGYYWVMANVTPSFDINGKVIGYFSVRRQPSKQMITVFSQLYQKMLQAENNKNPKQAVEDSTKILTDFIQEQGVSYNEYIISLTK